MLIFAFSTPVGILIGWAASAASKLLAAILMALSAGIFIYIATGEIMVKEFSNREYFKFKVLAYLLGITILAVLIGTAVEEHEHWYFFLNF